MLPTNPLLNATAPAGPHLPVATLRQYAAGTLAPAAQHRVEAHTLDCPRCADILEGFLQTPANTTDHALAQLQQRLRRQVLAAHAARPTRPRTRTRQRWVVLQLATAVALLFGLVAGGWWSWQHRHAAPAGGASPAAVATAPTTPSLPEPTPTPPVAAELPMPVMPPAPTQPRHYHRAPHSLAPAATHRSPARTSAARLETAPADTASTRQVLVATAPKALVGAPTAATTNVAAAPSRLALRQPGAPDTGAASPNRSSSAAADVPRVPVEAMPASRAVAPAPVGGYSALREKLRHGAAEFKPELPDRPLSGKVQLRLTVGADGKLQRIDVIRGLRADYDEEAQRLVCEGTTWVPGISGGKRATLTIDLAVPF